MPYRIQLFNFLYLMLSLYIIPFIEFNQSVVMLPVSLTQLEIGNNIIKTLHLFIKKNEILNV